jgi:hypothetical protein
MHCAINRKVAESISGDVIGTFIDLSFRQHYDPDIDSASISLGVKAAIA